MIMKKIIVQIAVIGIAAIVSSVVSIYYYRRSDIAVWAQAEVKPHDELVLGMAHMAFRQTMLSKTQGVDAANSNRLAVIRSLFQMYPNKNWGVMTEIVEEMKAGIRASPEMFPNICIEPVHPGNAKPPPQP